MASDHDRDDDWMDRWRGRADTEIAAAWISYQARPHTSRSDEGEDWWAVDAMIGLATDDPLRALEVAFLIARSSGDPNVLEMLGASPLEDLLSEDPTLFDAVALEAQSNLNLRTALKSVWQSTIPDDVWAALQRLVG